MTTFRFPKPPILDAIELNQNTVIEASAGTGKTFTIEHLVIDLLLKGEARIDQILVVTFTRRATFELRLRIRALLNQVLQPGQHVVEASPEAPHWVVDDERLALLRDAQLRFDQAPIYTIHGFCQRVLVEHAFEHQRLFGESHVHDDPLFVQTFHDLLRTTLSTGPETRPWLDAWLALGSSVESLQQELLLCHRSRLDLAPALGPAERLALLDEARAAVEGARASDTLGVRVQTEALRTFLPLVADALATRKAELGVFAYDDMLDMVWSSLQSEERGFRLVRALRDRYRYALIDEFQDTDPVQWRIFESIFLQSQGRNTFYLIGDPKQAIYGFRGADVHTYLAARDQVIAQRGKRLHLVDNFRSTASLIDAYNLIFDQEAASPLFTGRIQYDAPVRCGRPELGIEGTAGEPVAAIELLCLDTRDKVTADTVRASFADAIAEEIAAILAGGLRVVGRAEGRAEARGPIRPRDIFVLTRTGDETRTVGAALRRRGVPHAFYKEAGLFGTREASDILDVLTAVLDPSHRPARLRAWLTPFFDLTVAELEGFDAAEPEPMGPRTVRQVLGLWHQLGKRRQLERLFSAMLDQSGLVRRCILFEPDARALTNYQHILELLTETAHQRSADLAELVSTLRAWIQERERPPGDESDIQRIEGDRDAVQVMTMHKSKGLEAEVVFLFGGFGRGRSGRVTTQDEAGSRSQLLSVRLLSPAERTLADAYQRHEAERLMYVAITRARGRLYLPYIPRDRAGKRAFASLAGDTAVLIERLDAIVEGLNDLPPGLFSTRPVSLVEPSDDRTTPDPVPPEASLATWVAPELLDQRPASDRAFRDLRDRHPIVTSYSSLKNAHGDIPALDALAAERSEPEVDLAGVDLDLDTLPRGPRFGVMIHYLFEHLPFDHAPTSPDLEAWLSVEPVHRVFEAASHELGLSREHRAYCERLCYQTLRSPIPLGDHTLSALAEVEADSREVDFTFPLPESAHPPLGAAPRGRLELENGYVVGVIDLLFQHNGRVFFGDWKSDLLERYDPDSLAAHVQGHYGVQARLYSLAMIKLLAVRGPEDYDRFGGFVYFFVRAMTPDRPGHGVHFDRPSWEELVAWDADLRAMGRP